jgi:hypothetical protein
MNEQLINPTTENVASEVLRLKKKEEEEEEEAETNLRSRDQGPYLRPVPYTELNALVLLDNGGTKHTRVVSLTFKISRCALRIILGERARHI